MAPPVRRKTDEVLASAQRDLKAQLALVRDELRRLTGEERALAGGLASIKADTRSSPSRGATGPTKPASASRRRSGGRRRRARVASKTTAERLQELRDQLATGPKSRNELAAALQVSPPRVQQLLAELGSAVSSKPDPGQRQGKLWSLTRAGSGAGAAKK